MVLLALLLLLLAALLLPIDSVLMTAEAFVLGLNPPAASKLLPSSSSSFVVVNKGATSSSSAASWRRQQQQLQSRTCCCTTTTTTTHPHNVMVRFMAPSSSNTFKPAALPLMEAGKALARAGELWVDLTSSSEFIESYSSSSSVGGVGDKKGDNNNIKKGNSNANTAALYASGVQLRNAGDALAQAGANGRFAYGMEMTCNELRESAACFKSVTQLLQQAITALAVVGSGDDDTDNNNNNNNNNNKSNSHHNNRLWRHVMERTMTHLMACSIALEAAGAGIMQRRPYADIGVKLLECGQALEEVANQWIRLLEQQQQQKDDDDDDDTTNIFASATLQAAVTLLGQQFALVATRIIQAGNQLVPSSSTTSKSTATSSTKPW